MKSKQQFVSVHLSLNVVICAKYCSCRGSCYSWATHCTDAWGQNHPAPLNEEHRLVANHILNVHVEPVTS